MWSRNQPVVSLTIFTAVALALLSGCDDSDQVAGRACISQSMKGTGAAPPGADASKAWKRQYRNVIGEKRLEEGKQVYEIFVPLPGDKFLKCYMFQSGQHGFWTSIY